MEQSFICIGCQHDLPLSFQMRTEGYCYMCDPNVTLEELLNDNQNIFTENSIVIGCNYHVKWQKEKSMRFVLVDIKNGKARLKTRRTKRDFCTDVSDLIFIMSKHNLSKARNIFNQNIINKY